MNNYEAVSIAEGFESGTKKQQIEAWQHLVDTGLAWELQGFFGRTAAALIEAGTITAKPSFAVVPASVDRGRYPYPDE